VDASAPDARVEGAQLKPFFCQVRSPSRAGSERELKLRAKLSAPYEPSSHGLVGQALVVRALLGKKVVVSHI
jgi:hypothetical protein